MAKLTFQNVARSPLFYIGLAIVVALFMQMNSGNFNFLSATITPSTTDVRIISHTNLAGKVLSPGSTVDVSVTLKNYGTGNADFYVEHRLVAASLYPSMMATISPAANAVSGETDSVITQKVTTLKPGENITLSFKAPVPTKQSMLAGKSNADTSYYQIIGAYLKAGDGYISKSAMATHAGVLVSAAQAGTTLKQSCTTKQDCNGWLIGNIECQQNACVEVPKEVSTTSSFNFTEFYHNNKVLVLALIFVVSILVLSISFDLGGKRE